MRKLWFEKRANCCRWCLWVEPIKETGLWSTAYRHISSAAAWWMGIKTGAPLSLCPVIVSIQANVFDYEAVQRWGPLKMFMCIKSLVYRSTFPLWNEDSHYRPGYGSAVESSGPCWWWWVSSWWCSSKGKKISWLSFSQTDMCPEPSSQTGCF